MLAPFSLCLLFSSVWQVTEAVDVYLSPAPAHLESTLSPEVASAAVSRHLGLEVFEPSQGAPDHEEYFVGQGEKNALLLTVEESDVDAILPFSLRPAFGLEIPPSTPISSLSSIVSTYLHRASHSFTSLFPSRELNDVDDVHALSSFYNAAEGPAFAAVDLIKLRAIGQAHGQSSNEYTGVTDELRAFLEEVVQDSRFNVAVLTFKAPSPVSLNKRQTPQQSQVPLPSTAPPEQPVGSISTCFSSVDKCNNGTSSCSGRGTCVESVKAGRTCFVCSCGVTKQGEGSKVKTEYWAGESCERKDVSGPFVLLTGTGIVIVLLIVGSISLLYTVGDEPLPSTLLATAVQSKHE